MNISMIDVAMDEDKYLTDEWTPELLQELYDATVDALSATSFTLPKVTVDDIYVGGLQVVHRSATMWLMRLRSKNEYNHKEVLYLRNVVAFSLMEDPDHPAMVKFRRLEQVGRLLGGWDSYGMYAKFPTPD